MITEHKILMADILRDYITNTVLDTDAPVVDLLQQATEDQKISQPLVSALWYLQTDITQWEKLTGIQSTLVLEKYVKPHHLAQISRDHGNRVWMCFSSPTDAGFFKLTMGNINPSERIGRELVKVTESSSIADTYRYVFLWEHRKQTGTSQNDY